MDAWRFLIVTAVICAACGAAQAPPGTDAESADAAVADVTDGAGGDTANAGMDAADALVPALPPTLTTAIVDAVQTLLADEFTRGLTLTIDVPWSGRWTTGIGLADADLNVPMQGMDHLRVGSITKTFVAAAILRDVEAGKLTLDSSVAPLLPEITIDPAITVAMLLGHRSGLFNYSDDGNVLTKTSQPITPEALYATATAHKPEFAPGAEYKYSNTNFIVLGMLLEKLHGVPLHLWLRQTLWTPLGLKHLWLEGAEEIGLQRVQGYLAGQAAPHFDTSWSWAAGALVANGSDLCTWMRALYVDASVVSASSLTAMVTPSPESKAAGDSYGLGTMIDPRGGRTVVGHTGSTMGFNGEVYIDRDSGICVAVLTNDFFGIRGTIAREVWKVLLAGL